MGEWDSNKRYESIKIPSRSQVINDRNDKQTSESKSSKDNSLEGQYFYEIEYGNSPMDGVGKFVLKAQTIEVAPKDEIRDLFDQMRDISRNSRHRYDSSRFFDPRVQQDNSHTFYKQGLFMKDFTDNYNENKPFNQYFPYYQMMGYEQLRTYFTWRTNIRKGIVEENSLSYAYLYIYELLSNIGVESPVEGLKQLMYFWKEFRVFNQSLDKYVIKWLKDYHIYYDLPHRFQMFITEHKLTEHYSNMLDHENSFELYYSISKYDIKKSAFYTEESKDMILTCFHKVMEVIEELSKEIGLNFSEAIFRPNKKMLPWKPFREALFYPWLKQKNRTVLLSEREIYICNNNQWAYNTVITSESGKQVIGYIMKQMEVTLRQVTGFKYKLTASMDNIQHEILDDFQKANIQLETVIVKSVEEFYKESTKTVVSVNHIELSRIREEAYATQEKLIVDEGEKLTSIDNNIMTNKANIEHGQQADSMSIDESYDLTQLTNKYYGSEYQKSNIDNVNNDNPWFILKNQLTEIELKALIVVLLDGNIREYADRHTIMIEVLVDGINEKSMELIGDVLLDEDFLLYEDYIEQVKEWIE